MSNLVITLIVSIDEEKAYIIMQMSFYQLSFTNNYLKIFDNLLTMLVDWSKSSQKMKKNDFWIIYTVSSQIVIMKNN
jgi:hypothetical protein